MCLTSVAFELNYVRERVAFNLEKGNALLIIAAGARGRPWGCVFVCASEDKICSGEREREREREREEAKRVIENID